MSARTEAGPVRPLTMISDRFYRTKVTECEELAAMAEDRDHREAFRDLAQKWRMLAASAAAQDRAPALDRF